MTEEELNKSFDNIKNILGDENYSLISGEIGSLITRNEEINKSIDNKDKEIKDLKEKNEKLVLANGSLLKQVPIKEEVKKAVKEPDDFNFRDLFDNKGHFKK